MSRKAVKAVAGMVTYPKAFDIWNYINIVHEGKANDEGKRRYSAQAGRRGRT